MTETPRTALLTAALLMLALVAAPTALARTDGNVKNGPAPGFSPTSETVVNSPNASAPTWCQNEDDYHSRTWSGSLSGSFTASERLCDAAVDYSGGIFWDAGGVGLQADVYVVGKLSDFTITAPGGDSHHAVLVGTSTSKGVTTQHYQACYVPRYSLSTNLGGAPLAGGTYAFTLSGTFSRATLAALSWMADVPFQQQNCPAAHRNLGA